MTLTDKLRRLSNKSRTPPKSTQPGGLLELARKRKLEQPGRRTPAQEEKHSSLMLKLKAGRKDCTPEISEARRICNLPIDLGMTEAALERFNYDLLLATAYDKENFRLWPCQADAIHAYMKHGGGFFPIGVGWGKTLTSLAIAAHAYSQGIFKILLLVPPGVYAQLVDHDIAWARNKITLALPFIKLGKKSKANRLKAVYSDKPGCYIMPYSLLSTVDSVELLDAISPELIICDEAHNVKNRRASRTRRFLNHVNENNPQLVCLSGTITSKGVADYQHLIRLALGDNCPLPRSPVMASEWGTVIDSGVYCSESNLCRPLVPLLHWAREHHPKENFPEVTTGFRKAYKHRLVSAPGVVATSDAEIGVSLVMSNHVLESEKTEGWIELQKLISQVETLYLTPNGDEIDHAIHAFKWMYELSSGFYNELVWQTPMELGKQRSIPPEEAERLLNKSKKHHEANQVYVKELRDFLENRSRPGYDTPMLVGLNISQHGAKYVGTGLSDLWKDMKALEFHRMPKRISHQIRVCPFKKDAAVLWASCLGKDTGGLIWVWHQEMGRWIMEGLREAGLDPLYAGAASTLFDPNNIEKSSRHIVVTSIEAHKEGKNLQPFQNQLYVQWPRSSKAAEQSLGRTHRNGQTADELIVDMLNSSPFDHQLFAACLNDALYIQQTTSMRQKLIIAGYDPMPRIYSPEFLRERGMENEHLDREMRIQMTERFGNFS